MAENVLNPYPALLSYSTDIPARLDRLPWCRWHLVVVISLGIAWVMDGMLIAIVGLIGAQLKRSDTLGLSEFQIGLVGSLYIAGCVTGSLFFGYLSDKFGRKRLFFVVPCVYSLAALVAAFAHSYVHFGSCMVMIGFGIGGEYSAINSAINEFIPARVRGTVDLIVNGTYWLGAAAGCASTLFFFNESIFAANVGWRVPFMVACGMGVIIILVRLRLPESPRWLLLNGRAHEAETIIFDIELAVKVATSLDLPLPEYEVEIRPTDIGFITLIRYLSTSFRERSILALSLILAQAFFYNAIFFSYALVLNVFYDVPASEAGLYEVPFCIGNFLGSALLGALFDRIGRKPMIVATYVVSALLLIGTGFLFRMSELTAVTQTVCWSVIFFVASASASSAYLTIAEIFPLDVRAMAISFFYSLGSGIGGITGPALFGYLVQGKSRDGVLYGYFVGSGLMLVAAFVEFCYGVEAEGKSLEAIAAEVQDEYVQAGSPTLSSGSAHSNVTSPCQSPSAATPSLNTKG